MIKTYPDSEEVHGVCPRCGGNITYPPLCNDLECELSWTAWGAELNKRVIQPRRNRYAHRKKQHQLSKRGKLRD